MTILETRLAYKIAWERVTHGINDEPNVSECQDLATALKVVRNGLVGNKARKLDATTVYSLDPLAKLLVLPGIDEETVSVKTETASVVALLCLPQENCLQAILSANFPDAILVSLQQMFHDGARLELAPSHLHLMRSLLQALATIFNVISDLIGPRGWSNMMRVPDRVHRSRHAPMGDEVKGKSVEAYPPTTSPSFPRLTRQARLTLQADCKAARAHLFEHAAYFQNLFEVCIGHAPSKHITNAVPLFQLIRAMSFDNRWWKLNIITSDTMNGWALCIEQSTGRVLEEAIGALHVFTEAKSNMTNERRSSNVDSLGGYHLNMSALVTATAKRLSEPNTRIRSLAAASLVALVKRSVVPVSKSSSDPASARRLLSILSQLVVDKSNDIKAEAAYAMAHLVSNDEELQAEALEIGCLPYLKVVLSLASPDSDLYLTVQSEAVGAMLRESTLLALSAIMATLDAARQQAIDIGCLKLIVMALSDPSPRVRASACQCCRALSRAVSVLRTALLDEGAGPKLLDLIDIKSEDECEGDDDDELPDVDDEVKVVAIGALCNLVLDFAPMKDELLNRNAVEKLVELTRSKNTEARLHALWALKNMTFWAPSELKSKVINTLTWEYIIALLRDKDTRVQEYAMALLRNVACGKPEDIQLVISGMGEDRLLSTLERQLSTDIVHIGRADALLLHSLYVVSNLASGNESQKRLTASRIGLLEAIANRMLHPNPDVRIATIWCIINITHKEGVANRRWGSTPIISVLRSIGVESNLRELKRDEALDIREKAGDALAVMEGRAPHDPLPCP